MQKFCDAKTLGFMKKADAQLIVDSGFPVETISVKRARKDDELLKNPQFECLFCPIIQNQRKVFPVKENLKRHYSKHLKYNRFKCGLKGCDYASYRNDHVKEHIEKKHGKKRGIDTVTLKH